MNDFDDCLFEIFDILETLGYIALLFSPLWVYLLVALLINLVP